MTIRALLRQDSNNLVRFVDLLKRTALVARLAAGLTIRFFAQTLCPLFLLCVFFPTRLAQSIARWGFATVVAIQCCTSFELFKEFQYKAKSWEKERRVVAKIEWPPGELLPNFGFIVTNMKKKTGRGGGILQ